MIKKIFKFRGNKIIMEQIGKRFYTITTIYSDGIKLYKSVSSKEEADERFNSEMAWLKVIYDI